MLSENASSINPVSSQKSCKYDSKPKSKPDKRPAPKTNSLSNKVIATGALGALMYNTSRHHIDHALLHSIGGGIVINTLIEPVTKLFGAEMVQPACHSIPGKNCKKSDKPKIFSERVNNAINGAYFGVVTHLVTQMIMI